VKLPPKVQQYVDRFDALSLRERLMVSVAVLAVVVYAGNTFFVNPLERQQDALLKQMQDQQEQTQALQLQITTLTRGAQQAAKAAAAKAAQLAELRSRLDALNRDIGAKEAELVQPERMNGLVTEMVRRSSGVRLLALRSLPTTEVQGVSGAAGTLYRHGVEVKVSGSFAALVAYLGEFENLPVKVSWGQLDLDANAYPVIGLDLVLNTLSTGRNWLKI
jgi:MSHA biogenesis protein MshJ